MLSWTAGIVILISKWQDQISINCPLLQVGFRYLFLWLFGLFVVCTAFGSLIIIWLINWPIYYSRTHKLKTFIIYTMYNYYTCKHIYLCLRISINYEDFDETYTCLIANRIQKKKKFCKFTFQLDDGRIALSKWYFRQKKLISIISYVGIHTYMYVAACF